MSSATSLWLCPDQIFDGNRLKPGQAVRVSDGVVEDICPVSDIDDKTPKRELNGILTPGYLDLQVNGGGGVLFNQDPSPEGIAQIAAAHRHFGTVGILATVITDAPEILTKAVDAVLHAKGSKGLLGIHIEGPHISMARRGTHATRFIRDLDQSTVDHAARLRAEDIPVMLTLAPEAAKPDQVSVLNDLGVIVSIGHSDAEVADCNALLDAGASCFTHLFNAMSPMLNRSPGVTGSAVSSAAYAGIICDGIHVADEMVGIALRGKPIADRMFLVSDAMPTVGGPDHFRLYDMDIRLAEDRLVNTEGSLAGAHVTMAQSVARLVSHVGVSREEALRMAVTVPSNLMSLDLDRITGRSTEDLLLLDDDLVPVSVGLSDVVARESATA